MIVALAFLGIAEDLVGLVDLLEFRLRRLLVLGHIGMMLAREAAEGFADFILRSALRHAERRVIILVLNGHNARGR